MATVDINKVYPAYIHPSTLWWVFRMKITQGDNTIWTFTPVSQTTYPTLALATDAFTKLTADLKPAEIKMTLGPVYREEAFTWTTVNPVVNVSVPAQSS